VPGREFGCPCRRAAVIVLLPAHAWGRHLPDRPRLGHLSPGGPRSDAVWEARGGAAAAPRDARGPGSLDLRCAPPRPDYPTPGPLLPETGRSRRSGAASDTSSGRTPGSRSRHPGPGPLSPAPQLAPGGGVVSGAAPCVPTAARTRDPARRPPPGLRREEETGRAAAEEGGDPGRRRAGLPLPGLAARGPRSARGWRRHFPAAKLRPAPRGPAARASARRHAQPCASPRGRGPLKPPPGWRAPCAERAAFGRDHLRLAKCLTPHRVLPRASSCVRGPKNRCALACNSLTTTSAPETWLEE
jgi:hypothetical protein